MSNVLQIAPAINPLVELQKEFVLSTIGGEIRIMSRHEINAVTKGSVGNVNMYKPSDGKVLLRRHLETLPVTCEVKKTIEDFQASPNTTVYSETAFSPLKTPPSTLNYWVDSPVVPCPGDWSAIQDFLLNIICDGDQILFEYLIHFLAHMLQKPEEKPGIFIVLLGGQGTGKGTFFRLLNSIWPTTTMLVSDVNHVIGNFNGAIERNFVVCMDEAIFAGDKKSLDRLKSMLTEPTITIEQKYQPRRTIESFHRFFAASNHTHFATVDKDDRRFVFLRVSNKYKEHHQHWAQLYKTLDDSSVLGAFAHHLHNLDLSTFNVRNRPKTTEHIEQKIRSLIGFERFWFEVLRWKHFSPGDGGDPVEEWSDACFIYTSSLIENHGRYFKSAKQYEPIQGYVICKELKRLCPTAIAGRKQRYGNQPLRGYTLPALPEARSFFEESMGAPIDWAD